MVEISTIIFKFNTFNSIGASDFAGTPVPHRNFSWLYAFYLCRASITAHTCSQTAVRRKMIVLRSPFHYKSPKHHIGYSFFTVTVRVVVSSTRIARTLRALRASTAQQKPHVCQIITRRSLSFLRLVNGVRLTQNSLNK